MSYSKKLYMDGHDEHNVHTGGLSVESCILADAMWGMYL